MAGEKLRMHSKIIYEETVGNFLLKFIAHGQAIKYENIEKNLLAKGMNIPVQYNSVAYRGFINYRDLDRYYEGNPFYMSVFAKEFVKEHPKVFSNAYHISRFLQRTNKEGIVPDLYQGATMSVFIFEFK